MSTFSASRSASLGYSAYCSNQERSMESWEPAVLDRFDAVQELLDKQEISELLARYLRAVDRGDVAAVRSCYLAGATEDHGGVFEGDAQAYVDSIAAVITHPKTRSSHSLTNVLVELAGDRAVAESYVTTFMAVRAAGDSVHSFVGARLIDTLERVAGRWGIAHRQLVWEWSHDTPAADTWLAGLLAPDLSVLRRGGKFPDDPVYTTSALPAETVGGR
jgi:hypothetical protein